MALFSSPIDDTTVTLEQNGVAVASPNASENRNGHEARWTWARTNQPLLFDDRKTSTRPTVLPFGKLSGSALGQAANGREAIARGGEMVVEGRISVDFGFAWSE